MAGLNAMEKKTKEEASKLKTNLSAEPLSITRNVRNEKSSLTLQNGSRYRGLLKTICLTGLAKGFPRTEKFIKDLGRRRMLRNSFSQGLIIYQGLWRDGKSNRQNGNPKHKHQGINNK